MSLFFFSWLTALLLAPAAGTLGAFLVWKRMAFFADSLAHSSILGLALAFLFSFSPYLGMALSGLAICGFLWAMKENRELPSDALLSLFSHFMLGLGVIAISLGQIRVDLLGLFLGNWLLVSAQDAAVQGAATGVILLTLWLVRRALLSDAIQEEIAKVERPHNNRHALVLHLALTLFVCVAIQTVGLLLLNALMIMPALIARHWARHPYAMIWLSVGFAVVILSGGLALAIWLDLPASPTASVLGGLIFGLSFWLRRVVLRPA